MREKSRLSFRRYGSSTKKQSKESPRAARLKRRLGASTKIEVRDKKCKTDGKSEQKVGKKRRCEDTEISSESEGIQANTRVKVCLKRLPMSQENKRSILTRAKVQDKTIKNSSVTDSAKKRKTRNSQLDNKQNSNDDSSVNLKKDARQSNKRSKSPVKTRNLPTRKTQNVKSVRVDSSSDEEVISSDESDRDASDDEDSVTEISEEETQDEAMVRYQAGLINQASLAMKVKSLEITLQKAQKQHSRQLQLKDEEIKRTKNELKWKDEQLEEMNELMSKNMELEARIKFMLSDKECYEKEVLKVKEEEENQKEEEKKREEEKLKKEREREKRKENRKSRADESAESEEDIDALFVSDSEDDIEVVEEKKAETTEKEDASVILVDNTTETGSERKSTVQSLNNSQTSQEDSEKQGRHNIRKVLGARRLQGETVKAAKTEKERRERARKQHEQHLVVTEKDPKSDMLTCSKLVLAFKEGTKEPLVEVNQKLVKKLKPHQWEGVQFMWDNVIESVDRMNDIDVGQGCILAHCMGLGKTLSVISFVHTLFKSKAIGYKRCLIVCPLNTVLNWQFEWKKWLDKKDQVQTYEMASCKHKHDRANLLSQWFKKGGVMIMGYQLFRILANYSGRSKKLKKTFEETLLDPGPQIVVCDEGHMLKNDASAISKAMNRVKTRRRVVLTGTPLQNNLVEYHCMMNFVKPSLLGTLREYKNRFVNPISNGQHSDSTLYDVKLMKKRAHILHEMLAGCVQRRDYSCLTKFLPEKQEYVVSVRLSDLQIELYKLYLQTHRPQADGTPQTGFQAASLFSDYQALMRIWTHPWVLKLDEIRQEYKALLEQDDELDTSDEEELISSDSEDEESTTVTSDESSEDTDAENVDDSDSNVNYKPRKLRSQTGPESGSEENGAGDGNQKLTRSSRQAKDESKDSAAKKQREFEKRQEGKGKLNGESCSDGGDNERKAKVLAGEVIRKWGSMSRHGGTEPLKLEDLKKKELWWHKLVKEDEHKEKLELSGKLILFFEILRMAETLGEKILVFSQSLLTLNIMEHFLAYKTEAAEKEMEEMKDKKGQKMKTVSLWKKEEDYLRMDGSTLAQSRSRFVNSFNDVKNKRLRLFLISTKAGGLGVNLEAANRVIIFDASWNPSHDIQSIFRVYRFGQVKPVYVYRFLAQGTMEEKIYDRQVTKETLSQRVVDEHQVDRHFTAADLQELYVFEPDKLNDPNCPKRPTPAVPKDIVLAELLTSHKDWIVGYHEHDSLLENRPEEDLSEEERAAAWEEYEKEKQGLYRTQDPMVHRPPRSQVYYPGPSAAEKPAPLHSVPPQARLQFSTFQMSQLPRVVQEILKYNPNIGQEELQRRLQAFLGMQPGLQNKFISMPAVSQSKVSKAATEAAESHTDMPSRLPKPGRVPATNL